MEAPKCKFCGERHWGNCAVLAEAARALPNRAPRKGDSILGGVKVEGHPTHPAAAPGVSSMIAGGNAPPARAAFDRVAYQRAYMKRWRARKAGEGD